MTTPPIGDGRASADDPAGSADQAGATEPAEPTNPVEPEPTERVEPPDRAEDAAAHRADKAGAAEEPAPDPAEGAAPDVEPESDLNLAPDPADGAAPDLDPEPDLDPDLNLAPDPADGAAPVLRARGLGLSVAGRPVFSGVDVDVAAGDLVAVVGLAGSGRSSLLLALTGRMAPTAGTLEVAGSRDPRRIRECTAVARIDGLVDLEDRLTVADAITERCLIDGVAPAAGRAAVRRAARTLGLTLRPDMLVEDLSARHRVLLAVALASARPAEVIVVDDVDAGLDIADQAAVFAALGMLAATGPAILASTVSSSAAPVDGIESPLPATVTRIRLAEPEERP